MATVNLRIKAATVYGDGHGGQVSEYNYASTSLTHTGLQVHLEETVVLCCSLCQHHLSTSKTVSATELIPPGCGGYVGPVTYLLVPDALKF